MSQLLNEPVSDTELDRLRSSALLLDVIADNVADLIAVVDSSGRRIWNNFAYAKRLGYLPEELKGSDSMVEIHPDDLPVVREAFEESMRLGRGRRIEYRMRRKDGGWLMLESEGRVAHGWNGHERCLVVVARDITARKQAEQENHERMRRHIERAKALAEFSSSEFLQNGDLAACFASIAETAIKLSSFQPMSIWTMEERETVLRCQQWSPEEAAPPEIEPLTAAARPGFFALVKKERVIAARSLENDERLAEIAPGLLAAGVRAVLLIPLRRGSVVLGALVCGRTTSPQGWDLDELHFMTSLADGLVLAIDARERLDAYHRLHESQQRLASELHEAAAYVQSLLPARLQGAVESDWRFIPSEALGGDAFGYYWIDPDHLLIYLLDVVGHGVRAALVSVAVMYQLRNGVLADEILLDPPQLLTALNDAFQMEEQDGMYFTMWYGVYDKTRRQLHYASAGHPPALLFSPGSSAPAQLSTRGLMIGAIPGVPYDAATCEIEPGSRLFIFSDGVYEIQRPTGAMGTLPELIQQLSAARDADLDQIISAVRSMQRPGCTAFPDDFSLVALAFP